MERSLYLQNFSIPNLLQLAIHFKSKKSNKTAELIQLFALFLTHSVNSGVSTSCKMQSKKKENYFCQSIKCRFSNPTPACDQ